MRATATAKRLFQSFREATQKKSIYARVKEYRGFVPIKYETDDYIVTTAQTSQELFKVLELRHEVFVKEWQGRKAFHGLDVDDYDFAADHLMIKEKKSGEVVGTYRLLSSHFTTDFYSSSEFSIDYFLRLPSVKLEMGRACVHPDFRDGGSIDILWKGLTQYIFKTKTEYLFGCSSVKSEDGEKISRLYQNLRASDHWSDSFHVRPTSDYEFPGFSSEIVQPLTHEEKRELMPPLLRSYLHAGAKVFGYPALDRDFACTDLLTILDWKQLNPRFQSRFMVKG